MRSCAVHGCEVKSEDVSFFEFPTSRSLRRRWLDVIKLDGKLTTSSVVCSQHFMKNDYETIRGKVRLKRKVVPSLLLDKKKPKEPPVDTEPETTRTSPATSPSDKTVKHAKTENNKTNETEDCKTNGTEKDGNGHVKNYKVSSPNTIAEPDPKQDIEDMITNYQIKNKPNSVLAASIDEDMRALSASEHERADASEILDVETTPDLIMLPEVKPVFIEISVDKDENASGPGAGSQDCLMLLESVQVEIDPTSLMLPERDYDDEDDKAPDKKEDPISLLTSSDEDDVIIEEPHIDTVDVSDETDEDDIPLTRLVKTNAKSKKMQAKKEKTLNMVMWGGYEYYCVHCHYTTMCNSDYTRHVAGHSKVLQICAICSYTTASKAQYSRHMRKHKEEKLFRCHLCGYKAKHNMSLIYHLKSHDKANLVSAKRGFKCKKCNFKSGIKSIVLKHVRLCSTSVAKYSCGNCEYETARRSDLRRHRSRKHKDDVEGVGDDEYWP